MLKYFNHTTFENMDKVLRKAPAGYKYSFVENVFNQNVYQDLVDHFPDHKTFELIDRESGGGWKRFWSGPFYHANRDHGSYYELLNTYPLWREVLREAASPEFMKLLSEKTGVPVNTLATFGFTYGDEGCRQEAHLDGAVLADDKTPVKPKIAALLYFGKKPGEKGVGTELYDPETKQPFYAAEHAYNALFFFEQHPKAWHGFPRMGAGQERWLVSLQFSNEAIPLSVLPSDDAVRKSQALRQGSASMKRGVYKFKRALLKLVGR